MEITAIEPRRKGFSQLYIDGEAAVKLDAQVVLLSHLKPGMDITDEELYDLIQKSNKRRASEKALYLLEYRSHSKKELADKIVRAAIPREDAEAAAEHMEAIGLIDDEVYARSLAKSLFERKHFGARRVRQELIQKGIDKVMIEEILETLTPEDSGEHIQIILEKKYSKWSTDEKVKRRAFAALQRMGFSYSDIRSAMRSEDDYY